MQRGDSRDWWNAEEDRDNGVFRAHSGRWDEDAMESDREPHEDKSWGWGRGRGASLLGDDGSLSEWWSGRWGGVKKWFRNSDTRAYAEALQAVRRVGSIVYGKRLAFSWVGQEDARAAHIGEGADAVVQLSTAPLKASMPSWTEGQRVDALVGDSLSRAAHWQYTVPAVPDLTSKNTIVREAGILAARKPEINGVEKDLAAAGESLYDGGDIVMCEGKVTQEFPGYRGYFRAERDLAHRPEVANDTKDAMAGLFDMSPRSLRGVALAALWSTLRPEEPLALPAAADAECAAVVEAVAKRLRTAGDARDNLENTRLAMQELARFCVEESEDNGGCDKDGETERADAGVAAQGMGAGNRAAPTEGMQNAEAEEAEDAATRELSKSTEKGELFSIGRTYGRREYPIMTILARPEPKKYRQSLTKVRGLIARTRASLAFRNERCSDDERGLRRGLVDEGSLTKALEGDPTLFRRVEVVNSPEVDVGILVDESGSMNAHAKTGVWSAGSNTRAAMARECAILLYEACKGLRGVRTSVWGHTANTEWDDNGALVLRYIENDKGDPNRLGDIQARANNADGCAIAYCAGKMEQAGEGKQKILFVLADGYPSAEEYGGNPAIEHVRTVIETARRRGVQVFMLGMGASLQPAMVEQMFGGGGYALVEDATKLPAALAGLLKSALRTGRV
jgi:hypothetical protein